MTYSASTPCLVKPPPAPPVLNEPGIVAATLSPLGSKPVEEFWALPLNTHLHLVGRPLMIHRGDVAYCDVSIRALFRAVLSRPTATGFVVAHNHPSGSLVVSEPDAQITRKIVAASRILELPLHDHLILAGDAWVSIRQKCPEAWA
jgi:DNA repair protein RadC